MDASREPGTGAESRPSGAAAGGAGPIVDLVRRPIGRARQALRRGGKHTKLTIEAPRPIPAGWLLRLAFRNAGAVGTFEATVSTTEGADPSGLTTPWRLAWRHNTAKAEVRLEPGDAELFRLAIARTSRSEPDFLLLALDDATREERRYPAARRNDTTFRIRIRHCERDKVVADRHVRLAYETRDGELVPTVTFVRRGGSGATAAHAPMVPEPVVPVTEPSQPPDPAPPTSSASDALTEEAQRFSEMDNRYLRDVGLGSVPYFREQIAANLDLAASIRRHLAGRDHTAALTLACGTMTGEYRLLKRVGIAQIDAWDISEGQREKFYRDVYDGEVPVTYGIRDVNEIELEPSRYDVVYLQHAYHHVEALEHVADEIRTSLKPGGILAIVDFVGGNFLQRTPRQRDLCGAIWRTMPERYRIARNGKVVPELRIPPKDSLPPYEAVRSEEILPVLRARFEAEELFLYAGILYPLFNGFAQHYTDSAEDREFTRIMWDLDRWLIETGNIEPSYMKAIFVPRPR